MKNQATWLISMFILTSGILAGCSSATTPTQQTSNQTNISSSNSSNQISQTANNSSNDSTSTVPSGQTVSTGQATGETTNHSSNPSNMNQIVKQYLSFAKEGKIGDIPFAAQSNMDAVYQTWGHRQETSAGAGLYTTYANQHAAFGFNKGGQIFDLRSFNPQLKSITQSDITHALGTPGAIRYTNDSYIYMYPAGVDYQLLWVFQKDGSGKPITQVDHVSVFWPQGTINSMAATDPAPNIVLENQPGEVGKLFTFSIINPSNNYHLSELEWIPNHGTSIVTTLSQAVENARTGNNIPGFTISQDGQTMSFVYSQSMIGQSGIVRAIFQTTSGVATMGNSPNVTLK